MARKQKKPRKHFKVNLERIARHIGKIIDNTSVKDIAEVGLMISLAYAAYEAFHDWKGALVGPISLKLAMSPGGTPPIAQITGVAGLTLIGLANLGHVSRYYVTIPGTDIELPQSLPDPLKYIPEEIEKMRRGEKPSGWYLPVG